MRQELLVTKMNVFLRNLGTGESIPNVGHCEGLSFLLFRASLAGERQAYLDRLQLLANSSEDHLEIIAERLGLFRNALDRISNDAGRQEAYKLAIAACRGDKTKIAVVREKFYSENRKQAIAEVLKSSDNPVEDERLLADAEELYIFINMLRFAHSPAFTTQLRDSDEQYVGQGGYAHKLNVLMPDKLLRPDLSDKSPIRRELSFSFVFRPEEVNTFFTENLKEGDLVRIASTDHVMYVTMQKGSVSCLYDANYETGMTKFPTTKLLAEDVIKQFFANFGVSIGAVPISFDFYRASESNRVSRPTTAEIIKDIFANRDAHELQRSGHKLANNGINDKTWDGHTALGVAVMSGNTAAVIDLLVRKADITVKNNNDETILTFAIMSGDDLTFDFILNEFMQKGLEINTSGKVGFTTKMTAIEYGTCHMLERLLQVDEEKSKKSNTAAIGLESEFDSAVNYDRTDMLDLLFKHGFVPDVPQWDSFKNHVANLISISPRTVLNFMFLFSSDKEIEGEEILKPEHFIELQREFCQMYAEAKPEDRFSLLNKLFNAHDKFRIGIIYADEAKLAKVVAKYGDVESIALLQRYDIEVNVPAVAKVGVFKAANDAVINESKVVDAPIVKKDVNPPL